MPTQKDIKGRISSVKNIKKITRAMEMVAAARLRRAEQRIEALRPYARAIRRMTGQAVEAAENIPRLPLLDEHERVERVGLLLITGDRGLAGAFNSQIIRAGNRRRAELAREGKEAVWYAVGRRGVSSIEFRGFDLAGGYTGFTDRPAYADARRIADELSAAYVDGKLDRVEIIFNHYVSPMTQEVRDNVLLPLQQMAALVAEAEAERGARGDQPRERTADGGQDGGGDGGGARGGDDGRGEPRALWIYEPDPDEILRRLIPDFVEITIFRALLESTASEHGARMTAMRNASDNATDLIENLTLEANRQRQAEITQEIMEVVAGAEGLS